MDGRKIQSDAEKRLRELLNDVRKNPDHCVRQLTFALFVGEALMLAQTFRIVFPFALLGIFVAIHMTNAVEDWLDEVAKQYNAKSYRFRWLMFRPTIAAFWIHIFEQSIGRIPLVSFLTDFSVLVVVWVSAIIFVIMHFTDKFDLGIQAPNALFEQTNSQDHKDKTNQ